MIVCKISHTIIFFSKRVIFVRMSRDIALMMLGGAVVLAYQKYNEPVKEEICKFTDQAKKNMKKANKKLEDMM